jgi:hypothetical protein
MRRPAIGLVGAFMLKWFVRVVVALVVLFLGVSFYLPGEMTVEEAVTVPSRVDAVIPLLVDFRRWPEWTQFNSKNDATVKWTYSGKPTGAGSVAEWQGKEMGGGQLEMTEDDPKTGIQFVVRAKSHVPAHGRIVIESVPTGTVVTWAMTEQVPPLLRIFSLGTRAAIKDELHTQLTQLSEAATKH